MTSRCPTIARCGGVEDHDGPCQFGGEYETALHAENARLRKDMFKQMHHANEQIGELEAKLERREADMRELEEFVRDALPSDEKRTEEDSSPEPKWGDYQ